MDETRVYIVEDSLTIRAMLETLIGQDGRLDICGMAADGEAALRGIKRALPDIVILDLDLPGLDGFSLLDEIRDHWHKMHPIIVSRAATQDSATCLSALLRGAAACFDKAALHSHEDEFAALLHQVGRGRIRPSQHKGVAVTLKH